eukprot:762936-Hanusia_phi.AAC.1
MTRRGDSKRGLWGRWMGWSTVDHAQTWGVARGHGDEATRRRGEGRDGERKKSYNGGDAGCYDGGGKDERAERMRIDC